MDPDPRAGAGRRRPRHQARLRAALGPVRDPLRVDAQGPGRVGQGRRSARGVRVEHIPVRVDDDAVRWDVTHVLVVATKTVNSPDLLERLKERAKEKPHRYTFICPQVRRRAARGGQPEPGRDPGRDVPRRDRRHRPADEPRALHGDRERDRALPDRRDPDLDPEGRAVEVARGGPDRPASRRSPTSRSSTSRRAPRARPPAPAAAPVGGAS